METDSAADVQFMSRALELAEAAAAGGEVPVGALLVHKGLVLGEGQNRPITDVDATAHAEINAIRAAGLRTGNYRLVDTTLYVTLEPCAMCVGAMVHARIARLVFGAAEPKGGAVVSQQRLLNMEYWNHRVAVTGGVLAEQAGQLLTSFFQQRRNAQKALRQSGGGAGSAP